MNMFLIRLSLVFSLTLFISCTDTEVGKTKKLDTLKITSSGSSIGSGSTDGGTTDGGDTAGTTDGGTTDGGTTDGGDTAGTTDGGTTDGGTTDGGDTAGSTDGGTNDGGTSDGGDTAGTTDGGTNDGGTTDGGGSGSGDGDDGLASDGGGSADGSGDGGNGSENSNNIDICHHAQDNQLQDLSLPQSAIAAHLAHGDTLGKCPEVVIHQHEDEFTQNSISIEEQKVDIAFVIDNSGSMWDNQIALSQNLHFFINALLQKDNLDFRLMATTTDPRKYRPNGDGKLLKGNGKDLITREDFVNNPDFAMAAFKDMVKPGVTGSGKECFLNGAMRILQRNSHLFRPLAKNVFVLIGDEDGSSLSHFNKPFEYFVNAIRSEGTKVFSVVNTTTNNLGPFESKGFVQMAASDKSYNIQGNWGQNLKVIGEQIVNLLTTFPLSKVPVDIEAIKVTVNNKLTDGWNYNSADNTINFGENPPAEGAVIKVKYEYVHNP